MKKLLLVLLSAGLFLTSCSNSNEKSTEKETTIESTIAATIETTQETTKATEATILETEEPSSVESDAEFKSGNLDNPLVGLSVEETLNTFLTAFKTMDPDLVKPFGIDPNEFSAAIGIDPVVLFGDLDWTILDVEESGDTATIQLSVTTKDISSAMHSFYTRSQEILEEANSATPERQLEMSEEIMTYFIGLIETADLTTTELTIEHNLKDDVWELTEDSFNPLFDAITGGMLTAMEELS